MATLTVGLSGRYTNKSGVSGIWHELHDSTPGYGGIVASGSVTITRENGSATLTVSGSINNRLVNGAYYGYNMYFGMVSGSGTSSAKNAADKSNVYVNNPNVLSKINIGTPSSSSSGATFTIKPSDVYFNNTTNETIYICLYCTQPGGCQLGYSGSSSSPSSDWVVIGSFNTADIPYYVGPTNYSFNSITPSIGNLSETTFTVNYTYEGGNSNLASTVARIYDTSGTLKVQYGLSNTEKGTHSGTFKLGSGIFNNETEYKVSIYFTDKADKKYETSKKTIYTYRVPSINNLTIDNSTFSGTGGAKLSWTTNGRKWPTNLESDFTTQLQFGDKNWFNADSNSPNTNDSGTDTISQYITETLLNEQFSDSERNTNSLSFVIRAKRNNVSSGKSATTTMSSVIVQYKPKYAPTDLKFTNAENGRLISAGETIYYTDEPKLKIDWNYSDKIDRGYISGYLVRIYNNSSYTGEPVFSDTTSNKYMEVMSKTNLARGVMNYVQITAYYLQPNGVLNEGPVIRSSFVKPVGRLAKPVIDYPINKTTWINNNFRILVTAPEDEDYDQYSDDIKRNYRYKNMEVQVNNQVFAFTAEAQDLVYPIFSSTSLTYKIPLVINPSISGVLTSATSFTMKVRFQKNYYENSWSAWSNEVYIDKNGINELSLQKEQKIQASHYNTMQNKVEASWRVYPINSRSADDKALNVGDVIAQKNYQAIYNTILGIQSGVNSYADFSSGRENIKFNQTIDKLSGNNEPTDELVTAAKDPRPTTEGRNYINILIEMLNKLF